MTKRYNRLAHKTILACEQRTSKLVAGFLAGKIILLLPLFMTGCEEQPRPIEPEEAADFSLRWSQRACEHSRHCVVEFLKEVGGGASFPDDAQLYEDCWPGLSKQFEKQLQPCKRWRPELAQACIDESENAGCNRNMVEKAPSCDELFINRNIWTPGASVR